MRAPKSVLARVASAILGLAFGLGSAELTFGQLRPVEHETAEPVLYSIEVRDEAGALLASPMLVGGENQPVHLEMSRDMGPHSEPLAMSLDLTPETTGGNNLCVGYKVSIDDGFAHSGRIAASYGEKRSVRVRSGQGESLKLSLVVAKARSRAFDLILRGHRKPSA